MSTETITPLWEDGATFDLSTVDENARPDLLPKGFYNAFCDEATLEQSKAGEPMLVFKFKIESYEDQAVHGRTLRQYVLFTRDFGKQQLKRVAVALNPEIDFTTFAPASVAVYFEGRPCRLKVGQRKRKDTGELQNDIIEVQAPAGSDFWG